MDNNEILKELKAIQRELYQIKCILARRMFKREKLYYDTKTNMWISESELEKVDEE